MNTTIEGESKVDRALSDWADPGFFSERLSRGANVRRLLRMMLIPPKNHRTIPTPAGYVLILVSLGIGVAALNTANNILFMAFSLLLSSLILSGILSWVNFKGTKWRLIVPQHFRVGDSARLDIELTNEKSILPTYAIWFRVGAEKEETLRRVSLNGRLEPEQQTFVSWDFIPEHRGEDRISVSGLESQFPFGFLKKSIGGGIDHPIVVAPARVEYDFQPGGGRRSYFRGEAVHRRGDGLELIHIRNYSPGDPQRMVHWKASARMQRLVVRQMSEETRDGFVLFLQSPESVWQDEAQFERMCSFAASLGEDLFAQDRLLGFSVNGDAVVPIARLTDLHRFLEELGRLERIPKLPYGAVPIPANGITFSPGKPPFVYVRIGDKQAGSA